MRNTEASGVIELRRVERNNPFADLCVFLEGLRRAQGLRALALADADGLLIAGAGKYSDCEELSALASDRAGLECAHVLGRFALLGSEVLLCAPSAVAAPGMVDQVRQACERIFAVPRRPRLRGAA